MVVNMYREKIARCVRDILTAEEGLNIVDIPERRSFYEGFKVSVAPAS